MGVIAFLQPDELITGYLGHVAALNGRSSRREVAQLFHAHPSGTDGHGSRLLDAIAAQNGMQTTELIARHTCYPLISGMAEAAVADGHDGHIRYVTVVRSDRPHLGFCRACVAADLARGETAYWRRRHQLPGRYRCHVHGQPLVFVPECELMTERLEALQGAALAFDHSRAHAERATEILDRVLVDGLRLNRDRCMRAIRLALTQSGVDPSEPRWFAGFSAAIDKTFSLPWLRFAFPKATFVEDRLRTFAMGCISDRGITISHTAMAVTASMIFPSADAAIEAFICPA